MSQINPNKIIASKILTIGKSCEIQQVGIDLAIKGPVFVPHGHSVNVLLDAKIHLPDNVYSTFTHRSSFNRKGILITGSIYDPGYKGVVGCSIYNMSGRELILAKGERIGQMVFFDADSASDYNGQWQNEHLGA